MSLAYSVNGGDEIHGVDSGWRRIPIRLDVDVVTTFGDWAMNTWRLGKLPGGTASTLTALQGTALTSLETNDITDRDAAATYSTVFLQSIAGRVNGLNLENVTIEFMVKVS